MTWHGTKYKGVRYREHPTRKHGLKKDCYFSIRYQRGGKRIEEGLGWTSEVDPSDGQNWTEAKAALVLERLKGAARQGTTEAPTRLSEQREIEQKRREAETKALEEQQRRLQQEGETLADYFEHKYFPWAEDNKARNTLRSEKTLFNKWIAPVTGDVPVLKLAQTDTERLKKCMTDAGKAAKTVHLTLALVRQIYTHARRPDIYLLAKAKMPRVDNAKLRYLTAEEIDMLLTALKLKSATVHDQALLAVNTGLRFSEVAGLQWGDVNHETGTLAIRDGKTGSRTVFFNDTVGDMLKARQGERKTGLIFPIETGRKKGQRQEAVSKTFQREADRLFNQGVNDRRLRVSFHTMRHSFGTHVYGNTGDLYLTQKALGHRTMTMAQRYAKMSEARLKEAFNTMTKIMDRGKQAAREKKAAKVVHLDQ
jgi:integrase